MSELRFYNRKRGFNSKAVKEIFIWLFEILVMIGFATVLVFCLGQKTSVIGQSMEPALSNADSVLINKLIYTVTTPKRGDVIVFKPNGNENSHYFVKRVIGLPGERIQIKNGKIYVNGTALVEKEDFPELKEAGIAEEEQVLENDEYFVLGDNRNNSEDSRMANIGNVNKKDITGKAWFRITNFRDMGFIH